MSIDPRGITFKPVTRDNWQKLIKLDVLPEQYEFIGKHAGLYVLAHSALYPDWKNFAIYQQENMIGYFCCQYHEYPQVSASIIANFFIDKNFQNKGLGITAVTRLLDQIRAIYPDVQEIRFQVDADNKTARHILEKMDSYTSGNISATGKMLYCHSIP